MSNLFGNSTGSGFGSNQPQSSNPFSSLLTPPTSQNKSGGLFGSLNPATNTAQPQQQSSSLFGNLGNSAQQQQHGGGGLFGSSSQPAQGANLFSAPSQPQQQSGGPFGSLGQSTQQQQGGGLFSGLGANTQHQPQQQSGGLFSNLGQSTQQQSQQPQQQTGGLFGSLGQNTQQQQQLQQQPQASSVLGQSQQSRLGSIWQPGSGLSPRQKTIPEQIQLVAEKWDPNSSNTVFQTYLYNQVIEDQAPFYRPGPQDDEAKWEEALQKKPTPGSIPVLYKGFFQLGQRLLTQQRHLDVLQGRLHEINNSLTVMLQNHDLVISIRAADCRRKHLTLSQRSLALATKVQILRNRGYAMDSAEEELRKKLITLEKNVFDPALTGRGEEIWARMLSVRERARQLQAEFEKSGRGLSNGQGQELDEEVAKKAKKILEDYNAQLSHLTKELVQIQRDFAEWGGNSNTGVNGNGRGR
ncbi:MAG: hypothetical protein M1830_010311 [Pleopsidium flavum]|nr:MAG: hypothetical protein M1830_010311 [Pleopsidium flavum]